MEEDFDKFAAAAIIGMLSNDFCYINNNLMNCKILAKNASDIAIAMIEQKKITDLLKQKGVK